MKVNWDFKVIGNKSQDGVLHVDDKSTDFFRSSYSQNSADSLWTSQYKGRFTYNNNSDGAVFGPLSGKSVKIYVRMEGASFINAPPNHNELQKGQSTQPLASVGFYYPDPSDTEKQVSLNSQDDFTIGYEQRRIYKSIWVFN